MTLCTDSTTQENYDTLVSLDIQWAFDNIEFRDILTQLQ